MTGPTRQAAKSRLSHRLARVTWTSVKMLLQLVFEASP